MTPFVRSQLVAMPVRPFLAECMRAGATRAQAKAAYRALKADRIWVNDLYQVNVADLPEGALHLSIKRRDKEPIKDWRHFQQIKNELAGAEREAVEIYPAESRLVDTANQYHLWVLPPGMLVPFGFEERTVTSAPGMGAVQRPLEAG